MPRYIRGDWDKSFNLNKNTKIWLNYLIGGIIAVVLLTAIYRQTSHQFAQFKGADFWGNDVIGWLLLAVLLMPVNLGIEIFKWKLLAGSAQPLSRLNAVKSVLAGLAISLITPNRIGEYPGRLLYLKPKNTIRLISVTLLGVFSQFFTLFIYGVAGLIFYNIHYPGYPQQIILVIAILITTLLSLIFFRFETISQRLEKLPYVTRFKTYGQLLKRLTLKVQLSIMGLSLLRFSIFTAQYLILLTWMKIQFPIIPGFFMASLFFWTMAVLPSFALSELGVRGQVSIYLFQHFTDQTAGILAASVMLWFINIILPSIVGSILLLRMKLLK
jgi:hypothetical protein